jgi:hypothetical protein
MRLSIGLLALAGFVIAGFGVSAWKGYVGHRDTNLRAIHYDSNYDLSAQRRVPAE